MEGPKQWTENNLNTVSQMTSATQKNKAERERERVWRCRRRPRW